MKKKDIIVKQAEEIARLKTTIDYLQRESKTGLFPRASRINKSDAEYPIATPIKWVA